MTDVNTVPPPPEPPPPPSSSTPPPAAGAPSSVDERTMAIITYALLLAGFATGWLSAIVGLVLAYVNRNTVSEWLRSHYTFMIRTFWIGLAGTVVGCVLLPAFGLGALVLLAVVVWFIVRCAVGINKLLQNQPYPTPESWLI